VLNFVLNAFSVCRPENPSLQDVIKAHGAVFSVQAVFALWYIVGHFVLRDNDPLTFALARELLSASALVLLAQRFEGKIKVHSRRDVGDIILLVSHQPSCNSFVCFCCCLQLSVQQSSCISRVHMDRMVAPRSTWPVLPPGDHLLVLQGLMCYAVVMGFMFALSDLPEVTVAIAQPLVPALALGMSAVLGIEMLSYVSLGGIIISVAGMISGSACLYPQSPI
jgi:drug/metabolite transporter (DMT)-like permease